MVKMAFLTRTKKLELWPKCAVEELLFFSFRHAVNEITLDLRQLMKPVFWVSWEVFFLFVFFFS